LSLSYDQINVAELTTSSSLSVLNWTVADLPRLLRGFTVSAKTLLGYLTCPSTRIERHAGHEIKAEFH
jgi:hypothetical protein